MPGLSLGRSFSKLEPTDSPDHSGSTPPDCQPPSCCEMAGLFQATPYSEPSCCPLRLLRDHRPRTSGYNKNIFRYIIRRCFKFALSSPYIESLRALCLSLDADLQITIDLLRSSVELVSGVQYLECILRGREGEAIRQFLLWFLKTRYFRHLNQSGRMRNQQVYINFKNKFVLRQLLDMAVK